MRFVQINTYAKLCGVTVDAISKRILRGKLQVSEYCEMPAIDLEEYPPNRLKQKTTLPPVKRTLPDWCYD